jgi:hypothetical protein
MNRWTWIQLKYRPPVEQKTSCNFWPIFDLIFETESVRLVIETMIVLPMYFNRNPFSSYSSLPLSQNPFFLFHCCGNQDEKLFSWDEVANWLTSFDKSLIQNHSSFLQNSLSETEFFHLFEPLKNSSANISIWTCCCWYNFFNKLIKMVTLYTFFRENSWNWLCLKMCFWAESGWTV